MHFSASAAADLTGLHGVVGLIRVRDESKSAKAPPNPRGRLCMKHDGHASTHTCGVKSGNGDTALLQNLDIHMILKLRN